MQRLFVRPAALSPVRVAALMRVSEPHAADTPHGSGSQTPSRVCISILFRHMRLPVRSASKSRHGWNEAVDSPSNSRAGALAATAREHRPKGVMPENSVLA